MPSYQYKKSDCVDKTILWPSYIEYGAQGAVSIRKTVLPGMAIPMLKIRRPNGRLIFNMEIAIRNKTVFILRRGPGSEQTL